METKALVLLSGGLDSVYNLYMAHQKWPGQVEALFFDYGQKAAHREKEAASFFCGSLDVSLQFLDLKSVFKGGASALISGENQVPTDQVDINSLEKSQQSAEKVWVANRNGVFLNIGACWAEMKKAQFVVPGFNKEEAQTFPDNSQDYIQVLNASFKLSTQNGVQVYCFSHDMDKTQIYGSLAAMGASMEKIWACYHGGEEICGQCESCQRFLRAKAQGV